MKKQTLPKKLKNCWGHLQSNEFWATLVTSVADGTEAIDIPKSQDVFGIERDYLDASYFIGYEFIIYLLFEVLAEHYLKKWVTQDFLINNISL